MGAIEDAVRRKGGVWPSDDVEAVHLYELYDRYIAGFPGGTAPFVCTRTEFEECTKRLRNEPSWDDAPDWAVAKAQDSTGWWYWYSDKPFLSIVTPDVWQYNSTSGRCLKETRGEVIGDWKQTLRLRPEEKKVEDENDWYKRGEFPPVGTVCEVVYDGTWKQTKIIGWDDDKIVFTTQFDDITSYGCAVASPNIFRPLQTERERWVYAATKAAVGSLNHAEFLGRLYDSGLAKMPEDE